MTGSPVIADWQRWCRLCAKEDVQGNISVFFKDEQQPTVVASEAAGSATAVCPNGDLSLATAIEKYFWVNITRTDEELPKMLCTECFSLVTSLVNFSERVAKVQQMFCTLQQEFSTNTKLDLHAMRLKFGLLDEDREHVLIQQTLPEVHYFESKPKINELEERMFEAEPAVTINPLEQPRIKIKIKKEDILEERHNDEDHDDDDEDDDDPFHDELDEEEMDEEDEEFMTVKHAEDELPTAKQAAELIEIKKELSNLLEDKEPPKKRRRRHSKRKRSPVTADDDEDNDNDVKSDAEVEDVDLYSPIAAAKKSPNSESIFACTECPRKFKRIQHFRQHMKRTHSKLTPIPAISCAQCTRVFTTPHQLEKHEKVHLPMKLKKVIPCPYCDKKFTSSTLVQTHIKFTHMNERPFICEECGVAVRTNATLKTHMLTHTDYAPFECEVCKKGFKNQIRLRNHMETHDPNKHICAECGLQLNSRATLNRHLLVHSDEMQHKCDYCGRAFKRAKALKNHLILHTGLKPYSCDFCDRTFANGSNCRSHKKKAHPEELAALEAAGGGKMYTRNIPKLEALKAVTKAADNLAPVVSKQSGRFAFGKKPKPLKEEPAEKLPKNHNNKLTAIITTPTSSTEIELNSMHSTVPNTASSSGVNANNNHNNVPAIPTIDNIYNHIMKQATIAANNSIEPGHSPPSPGSAAAAIRIQIKRPASQASSSCVTIDHDSTSDMSQLQQQHVHLRQHLQSQTPTPNPSAQHFYTQIVKQGNLQQQQQQMTAAAVAHHQQQQQHHTLLAQQHEEMASSIRSPADSHASSSQHMGDDHSNASAHFYNHIRQNLPGPYM